MPTAITLEALPAAYGDCLWIECARAGRPWRMVVDGGPPEAATALEARIAGLGPDERAIDVVVVTHVDSDHIGGLLSVLTRTDVSVGDVWFNALPQLPQDAGPPARSVAEGEDLVQLLTGITRGRPFPWNAVVGGSALMTEGDRTFRELSLSNGPRITLLSPTPKRLIALRRVWEASLARLKRGESEEEEPRAPREPLFELDAVASTPTTNDTSIPNGSSIAFLLEHRGASCVLAADAFPTVLGGALWALANARGARPVEVDVLKVPHHGSRKNVTAKLLEYVPAKHYVISTNGDHFGHPDDVALARVVTARRGSTVWFNYEATAATARWADDELMERYEFRTQFAVAPLAGVRLELPQRE